MFCSNCGTELPNEANFCWKCGRPQKPDVEAEPVRYETCEIVWADVDKPGFLGMKPADFYFWARAIGPDGVYEAARSEELQNHFVLYKGLPIHRGAVDSVIATLVKDGWEPLSRGEHWWNERFRRRVT
jgi:hypothetical protein